MGNIIGIMKNMSGVQLARLAIKANMPNAAALRNAIQAVSDPSIMLPGKNGRAIVRLVYKDSGQRISVLKDQRGPLVLRYTKMCSDPDFREDPPHLIATSSGKLLVMKKNNPDLFTTRDDDGRTIYRHPTMEKVGASLLDVIGAPSYFVIRGFQHEYLEFLPGVDLLTLRQNERATLEELEANNDLFEKLAFSIGVSLSQAYVTGTRDRRGGTRLNMEALLESTCEEIAVGLNQPCYNIDMASALDMRVFERNAHSFLNVNNMHSLFSEANQEKAKKYIVLGFIAGFKQIIHDFRLNEGMASDTIRLLAQEKATYIFEKLNTPLEQIRQETEGYLLVQ